MRTQITNSVLGETVTFLRSASEGDGSISELEISVVPGGGNPLHYHTTYTETFTAIEGNLSLELRRHTQVLRPGESYTVAIGEVHRFFNPGIKEIRFRNDVRPGHEGFENTLRILAGLALAGHYNTQKKIPASFLDLAICAVLSDMRLPGFMSLSTPFVQWIARRPAGVKRKQELIDLYCR